MSFSASVFADYYWQMPNDLDVFSSVRLAYVSYSDAQFQTWLLDHGNIVTQIPNQQSLADVIQSLVLPLWFGKGVIIDFPNNSALTAAYGLDSTTLNQVHTLASDCACGLGFPLGAVSFSYPDLTGQPHSFASNEIIGLYKAMRDYVAGVTTETVAIIFRAPGAILPTTPVTALT